MTLSKPPSLNWSFGELSATKLILRIMYFFKVLLTIMKPKVLLPQIKNEDTVSEKCFLAFSWLHDVLGLDGVMRTVVKRARSGKQLMNNGSQGNTKAGVCDLPSLNPIFTSGGTASLNTPEEVKRLRVLEKMRLWVQRQWVRWWW